MPGRYVCIQILEDPGGNRLPFYTGNWKPLLFLQRFFFLPHKSLTAVFPIPLSLPHPPSGFLVGLFLSSLLVSFSCTFFAHLFRAPFTDTGNDTFLRTGVPDAVAMPLHRTPLSPKHGGRGRHATTPPRGRTLIPPPPPPPPPPSPPPPPPL